MSTSARSTSAADDREAHNGSLRETVEYIALRRVQNRYADIVTRRAWDELTEIMSPDCKVTVDTLDRSYRFNGPDEIGDFIGRQIERFSFFEFVVLNTVISIDHEHGTAGARMYMQELRQSSDDGRRTNAFGVYHDRLVKSPDDGSWRFVRRKYRSFARTAAPDAVGDLDVFDLPVIDLDEI